MGTEPRRFDLTMLHAAYGAFRRDAARLESAAGRKGALDWTAIENSWSLFSLHWRVQDLAEKNALWTVMYAKAADGMDEVGAVLDEMTLHALRTVPPMDAMDTALDQRSRDMFAECAQWLDAAAADLLDFKESDVLPLVPRTLTAFEWGGFDVEFRRELGMRGLAVFLPWLLDGADERTRRAVLRLLPPPIRLVYRTSWRPRYERRPRLAVPAC
ncbi:hypothetical protein ACFOY4_37005 [Actinomadura syzygii]|uniref:Hemerythrin domain-containing protein n=1 Tax=Actinomadura syzygii TaxID=1427538 RepID=A0A5D0TTP8_9ACTN|nr:hypothetical protein [Actinomadura syzygii]TYC09094.1 hypothetical protein FXF65_36940 [Actinomadura syzygii]